MNTEGAIAYIRDWRKEQNLESLSPQDEREAAAKLIQEKGYKLPEFIPDGQGSLHLNEGVYVMKDSIEIVKISNAEEQVAEGLFPLPPCPPAPLPLFPWESHDRREFWCDRHKSFVRLTGDLEANGTYWVNKSGEGTFNRYRAFGHELVLRENAPSSTPESELLLINSAGWGDIKNCLVNKFIPTYPWSKKGDKTPTQVREDMLILTKSRRQGLAGFIEEERKLGRFEDSQNFILRMNTVYESFPWGDFTQMLDFN
jgi:hypothetical protein